MTEMQPHFHLIGARPYVHSTTILNYLDLERSDREGPIDLKFSSKVLPGAQVSVASAQTAATLDLRAFAATALVGNRLFCFSNPAQAAGCARRPDTFSDILAFVTHANDQTLLDASPKGTSPHGFWERVVFGLKAHLALAAAGRGASAALESKVLLARIRCIRGHDADALRITTEIVLDGAWHRLGIYAEDRKMGDALVSL